MLVLSALYPQRIYGDEEMKTSSHKGKGKGWGSLTKQPRAGTTEGPSSGEGHGGSPSSKFIGPTKGNSDLPCNRTKGVSQGSYAGS